MTATNQDRANFRKGWEMAEAKEREETATVHFLMGRLIWIDEKIDYLDNGNIMVKDGEGGSGIGCWKTISGVV